MVEVRREAESNADLPDLILDKTFALVYDLPQFFYTHRSNRSLADRVTQGPGWPTPMVRCRPCFTHMSESLRFADLSKRRLFRLNAPPERDRLRLPALSPRPQPRDPK